MFNKKSTWIVFSLVSILFCIIAYKTFPKAFPILNISLEMSRNEAVEKAVDMGIWSESNKGNSLAEK